MFRRSCSKNTLQTASWNVVSISLSIVATTFVLTGCGPSASDIEKQKTKEEITNVTDVEKKALDQHRYLNSDEAKKVTSSLDKIAAASSPEEGKKLHAMSNAITAYRAKLEEFKALGGAKVETLKSPGDLEHRIALLDDLNKRSKEVTEACKANDPNPANLRTLELEQELLVKIREQLLFYKAHYGKWRINPSGPVLFDVSAAELETFNKISVQIRALGDEQMQIMKQNTEERLEKLKKIQQ